MFWFIIVMNVENLNLFCLNFDSFFLWEQKGNSRQ